MRPSTSLPTPNRQVKKCVALTFDDGPGPAANRLLDVLKAERVPATFFLVGSKVEPNRNTVQRMSLEGHLVANHSWAHPSLPTLSDAGVRQQVNMTDAAIQSAIGKPAALIRPHTATVTRESTGSSASPSSCGMPAHRTGSTRTRRRPSRWR